jgi:DNA-binding XRE family transcriptional regulator
MTEQQVIASQFRGARAMAGLKVAELARKADVAPNTIVRIEGGRKVSPRSLAAVQSALEASGIEFLDRGIRMKPDIRSGDDADIEQKVARILRLAKQIASLPVVREGSPEELIGYDEFGAPS